MQRRRTTKELLADSFIELSENKNIDKITIKDITENCELTPTTFYNHFHDKYDLMIWIYSTSVEKIMSKINNNSYEWRDTLFDGIDYYIKNKKFLLNAITHTSGQNSFINNMTRVNFKFLSEYIKMSNELKELPTDVEVLIKIYVYGTVCMLYEWLIDKNPMEFEEFVRLLEAGLPEPLKKYVYKNDQL